MFLGEQDGIGCSNGGNCTEFLTPSADMLQHQIPWELQGLMGFSHKPLTNASPVPIVPPLPTTTASGKQIRKKKCCLCSSHSLVASMNTMARFSYNGFVSYEMVTRHFCSKHAPPSNMVQSDRLLDDRQAMELAHFRDTNRKKRRFG